MEVTIWRSLDGLNSYGSGISHLFDPTLSPPPSGQTSAKSVLFGSRHLTPHVVRKYQRGAEKI